MFEKLCQWSRQHYSHLPWRKHRSLYSTLVSEIMLQQTTVGTVLNHFERFIKKYPDLKSLAASTEEQMLIDWKGLGYYRRARNLLKAAKELNEKYGGEIPADFDKLIAINGIGPYTANALIGIGANEKALCVDANLERVLARVYGIKVQKGPKLQKEIYQLFHANEIAKEMDQVGARDFNEALMDLGRTICKARSASCELCPLSTNCVAFKSKAPLAYPVDESKTKTESKKEKREIHLLRVVVEKDGKYLVYKKSEKEWLAGQYEIPTFILSTNDESLKQYPRLENDDLFNLPSFTTGITKYKITNYVLYANAEDLHQLGLSSHGYGWKKEAENLSTASSKAIKLS